MNETYIHNFSCHCWYGADLQKPFRATSFFSTLPHSNLDLTLIKWYHFLQHKVILRCCYIYHIVVRNDYLLHLLAHIALRSATFSVFFNIVIFKVILWQSSKDFMISQKTSYIFIQCYNFMLIYLYSYAIIYASVWFLCKYVLFI